MGQICGWYPVTSSSSSSLSNPSFRNVCLHLGAIDPQWSNSEFTPVASKTVSSPSLLGVFLDLCFGNLSLRDEFLNADNFLNPHFSCLRHKVSPPSFCFLPQRGARLSPETVCRTSLFGCADGKIGNQPLHPVLLFQLSIQHRWT